MTKLTANETVALLKELFEFNFGGKEKGRFKISIDKLLELSGHTLFTRRFFEELEAQAAEEGIMLINIGSFYAVIELDILKGYRNVPPHVVLKILKKG